MFHGDTRAYCQGIAQHSIVSGLYKKTLSMEGMKKHCIAVYQGCVRRPLFPRSSPAGQLDPGHQVLLTGVLALPGGGVGRSREKMQKELFSGLNLLGHTTVEATQNLHC